MLPGSQCSQREPIFKVSALPFYIAHLVPLLAFVTGVTTRAVVLCVALYLVRVFCITAGYHRYFAHRAYRMGRLPQFLVALGGALVGRGPLQRGLERRRRFLVHLQEGVLLQHLLESIAFEDRHFGIAVFGLQTALVEPGARQAGIA